MRETVKYLREREWDFGHGQCGECWGTKPGAWAPHPCVPTKDYEGHKKNCTFAKCLEELGQKVIFKTKGE